MNVTYLSRDKHVTTTLLNIPSDHNERIIFFREQQKSPSTASARRNKNCPQGKLMVQKVFHFSNEKDAKESLEYLKQRLLPLKRMQHQLKRKDHKNYFAQHFHGAASQEEYETGQRGATSQTNILADEEKQRELDKDYNLLLTYESAFAFDACTICLTTEYANTLPLRIEDFSSTAVISSTSSPAAALYAQYQHRQHLTNSQFNLTRMSQGKVPSMDSVQNWKSLDEFLKNEMIRRANMSARSYNDDANKSGNPSISQNNDSSPQLNSTRGVHVSSSLINERWILTFLQNLCRAIRLLHSKKIYLRSTLHETNIFVNQYGDIKIGDYGLYPLYEKVYQAQMLSQNSSTSQSAASTSSNQNILSTHSHLIPKDDSLAMRFDFWRMGLLVLKVMMTHILGSSDIVQVKSLFSPKQNEYAYIIEQFGSMLTSPTCHYSSDLLKILNGLLQEKDMKRPEPQQILSSPILQRMNKVSKRQISFLQHFYQQFLLSHSYEDVKDENVILVTKKRKTLLLSPIPTYYTISAAIEDARPNNIILVEGCNREYKENIEITKNISLFGQKNCVIRGSVLFRGGIMFSDFTVIQESQNSSAMTIESGRVEIRNCNIISHRINQLETPKELPSRLMSRNTPLLRPESSPMVLQRTLAQTGSNRKVLSSLRTPAILITSSQASPFIVNNHVHNSSGSGILINNYSTNATIVHNDIYNNYGYGIEISTESAARIKQNKIYDNQNSGIIVSENCQGVKIDENEIFENKEYGLLIQKYSKPIVELNTIHRNLFSGIALHYQARGKVSRNKVCLNNGYGIEMKHQSDALVEENHVFSNAKSGIIFFTRSKGKIVQNKVYQNNGNGMDITEHSDPLIAGNWINDNMGTGILVFENGESIIKKNDIYHNFLQAISITSGGFAILKANFIHDCPNIGILMTNNGRGTLQRNQITNCKKSGIVIQGLNSEAILNENIVKNCGGYGVSIFDGAVAELSSNCLSENMYDNLHASYDAQVSLLSGNKIINGHNRGISVNQNAQLIDMNPVEKSTPQSRSTIRSSMSQQKQSKLMNISANNRLKDCIETPDNLDVINLDIGKVISFVTRHK